MEFDLVITNAQVLLTQGDFAPRYTHHLTSIDIGIQNGKIRELGTRLSAKSKEVFDAQGLTVLPGIIDSQVHFREPGLTHKEDLLTGTQAAALGGITCVFEMPNTNPPTSSLEALREKVRLTKDRVWSDIGFYAGATADNTDLLPALELEPGCIGIKIFMGSSTGSLLVADDANLKRVLSSGRRRVAVHCEDEERLIERRPIVDREGATVFQHPEWRDELSALKATQRLIQIARQCHRPVHALHITTREEMQFLQTAKDIASVEVTPQHLTLSSPDCYERLGTFAQMNPPIRNRGHLEALWRGVELGTVDIMGSDHAPHTREEKLKPYPASPSGMPGVQTMLPVMLDHVDQRRLSLGRLVELLSLEPARLFGLTHKGRIAKGRDADLTFVDLKRKEEITSSWLRSRSGWSPFEGVKVTGWPVMTMIHGTWSMREGELSSTAPGRILEVPTGR